jgi:DNA-binding NtrC family response regulator
MILLVSSSTFSSECRSRLEQETGQQVNLALSVRQAARMLQTGTYSAVVIDQNLMDPDPLAIESMLERAGGAVPVHVNFAVHSAERLAREVRIGLRRAEFERMAAMRAATQNLRTELRDAVTGILLSTDLALAHRDLPAGAMAKIQAVRDIADAMRKQLAIGA